MAFELGGYGIIFGRGGGGLLGVDVGGKGGGRGIALLPVGGKGIELLGGGNGMLPFTGGGRGTVVPGPFGGGGIGFHNTAALFSITFPLLSRIYIFVSSSFR